MFERVYVVSTPENLTLRFERAGLATRAAALCLDLLAMAAVVQLGTSLLAPFQAFASAAATTLWIVAAFAVQWWYGALCEWRWGATFGKRLLRIRVVDSAGLPPSLLQAVARNLVRLVDFLPGLHLVGALACLADPQGRRLGDLAAQTLVVRDAPPSTVEGPARPSPSPRPPSYAEELAGRLNRDERLLVLTLVHGLDTLPVSQRLRLCAELAQHLASRHAVRLPAGISGERVLAVLAAALQST